MMCKCTISQEILLSLLCCLGVVDISNGAEPMDAKERKRQRARERYAQMGEEKKMNYLRSVVKPIKIRKLNYWLIPKRHDQVHTCRLLKVLNSRHNITCKYINSMVPCF